METFCLGIFQHAQTFCCLFTLFGFYSESDSLTMEYLDGLRLIISEGRSLILLWLCEKNPCMVFMK